MALKVYISKAVFCKKEAESDVMLCLKSEPDTDFCTDCHLVTAALILDGIHKGDGHALAFDSFASKRC